MSSNNHRHTACLLSGLAVASLVIGCTPKTPAVSFQNDIKPILDARCVECHRQGGDGSVASGVTLDDYEGVIRGTRFGRIVIPGDSFTSALVMLVEGRVDESIAMPHTGKKLDPAQIGMIKNWIDQGAKDN